MPFETPLAAEGNPESLRHVESFHAIGDRVGPDLQAQLSQPHDIASANQFFKPTGGEHFLLLGNVGPNHIEIGTMNPSGHFAAPPMTGLETHGLAAPAPGGDIAGLAGPGAMPGAEPISPLINMIMKMPGHIGLASSFFEALGAFFAPAMEAIGHVAGGLDIAGLFEHAGAAADAVAHGLEHGMDAAGDHLAVELNLLPTDAPIFDQLSSTSAEGLASGATDAGQSLHVHGHELNFNSDHHLRDSFAQSPKLEVGGGPASPIFEMSDNGNGLGFEGANNNYLAMEPNNGLGGTVGNFTSPTPPPIPPPIPPPTVVHPQLTPSMPHNSLSSHNPFSSFDKSALNHSRGDFGRDVTDHGSSHSPTAEHQPDDHSALGQHQSGQHQLGQHQLGQDHGTTGGDASIDKVQEVNQTGEAPPTNYTVHSGDNLWDISKDNLGGGEHWHQLYQGNETVIGANPDIIHPGQHLHVDGAHNFTTPAAGPAHSLAHSPTHAPVHLTGHAPTHTPTHPVAHGQAQASGHPTAHRATTVGTGELKAQAQKLSNIQSDTDITSQAVDSSTTVANTR